MKQFSWPPQATQITALPDLRIRTDPLLGQLPSCATTCLTAPSTMNNCSNAECICTNATVFTLAFDCFSNTCSFMDALYATNVTRTFCNHDSRDQSGTFNAIVIATAAVVIVVTIARLVFNRFFSSTRRLQLDDWCVALALLAYIGLVVLSVGMTFHGLGKDVWTVSHSDIPTLGVYIYLYTPLYRLQVTLVRGALCIFFTRILPVGTVRNLLWATATFLITFGLAIILVGVFACMPVSYNWTQFLNPQGGRCMNGFIASLTINVTLILLDIWMIAIPLSQVRMLKMPRARKAVPILMLLSGLLATIILALREYTLVANKEAFNVTWVWWVVFTWTQAECSVGMICVSLPCLRLIFRRFVPNRRISEACHSGASNSYHKGSQQSYQVTAIV